MNHKLTAIRPTALAAALAVACLFPDDSYSQLWGGEGLSPIKGLTLGMPIGEAVAVMNEKAGPIWAATMGQASANPYKVMRISGENMQALRLQIIQLMSLATMQLYRVDPADTQDLFIVVPSTAPDTAQDLGQVGSGVLQSLLFTGCHVHSHARLEGAVVLPQVDIGRAARLTRVVVDRGVRIPAGLVVGEDPVADASRFRRTDAGITLITQSMLDRLA